MALLMKQRLLGMVEEGECFVNGKCARKRSTVRENLEAVLQATWRQYSNASRSSTPANLEAVLERNWSPALRLFAKIIANQIDKIQKKQLYIMSTFF